jgi:hypothetical protein
MTMYSSVISGDDWQKFVVRLLYVRYGSNLIEVPDQHKGDHGIEAFTTDGCVYQCYAPDGDVGPAILAERHKTKITNDILKFKSNKSELAKLFGSTMISRWLLVVPDHCSSDVVAHSEKKAQELRDLDPSLSYLADDFKVITVNGYEFFSLQISQMEKNGGFLVEAEELALEPGQVEHFETANEEWLANLDRKLLSLPRLPKGSERAAFRERLLRYYLEGSNALTYYDQRFPLISERVRSLKEAESRSLEIESVLKSLTITKTREDFQQKMSEGIPSLGTVTADTLCWAAIVEWLMICPLDPTG